ncbi:universal stress protein [Sphingosinicella humi]|uniref:Universal stress protein n=1 Tax=Allosphingosinicella humi TaxID=2068657 RepID=A0A2U2J3V5_9SPHN|nr:universal stress protein [Sphingosinicella humi]PWG03026.1 universal stress protein [Sphingosinicella humi]
MKSILLYANEDPGLEVRVEAALNLVEADHGHLTCVQVMPFSSYVFGDPFGGTYVMAEAITGLEEQQAANRARVEQTLRRAQVPWTWLDYSGVPASVLVERSRLADIVVMSLPDGDGARADRVLPTTADVAVHARTLTLAVPDGGNAFDMSGRALIAWNGSAEASQALRLAVPLLQRASAVDIVTVIEDELNFPATDACEYLGYHGVRPELHEWQWSGRSVAECIDDAAAVLGSDYVLMGAYGHSRIREAVLGGVTRSMLNQSRRPLLLGH